MIRKTNYEILGTHAGEHGRQGGGGQQISQGRQTWQSSASEWEEGQAGVTENVHPTSSSAEGFEAS